MKNRDERGRFVKGHTFTEQELINMSRAKKGKPQTQEAIKARMDAILRHNREYGHWMQENPICGKEHYRATKTVLKFKNEDEVVFDTRVQCARYISERFEKGIGTVQGWIDRRFPLEVEMFIDYLVVGDRVIV
ncbi:hypothetical protein [Clostridium perfringens]|uniref:hypothetical protein n=1 Tax=Clostridium perfringens TaxID=1502 RepID=UPI00096A2686|nr:hypothetical protein [Clostridium perfringens]